MGFKLKMDRIIWKENHIISIETRNNIYVLAQMLKSPYLMIYNIFRDNENWGNIDLQNTPILFCHGVTRQFLNKSNITKQKKVKPVTHKNLPKYWIRLNDESQKVVIWEGTTNERSFIILGKGGGSLIENNIMSEGFRQSSIVIPKISFSDNETIDKYETSGLGTYAEFNERLYLCYKFGRNVDPYKELIFGRHLPIQYSGYFDIISS